MDSSVLEQSANREVNEKLNLSVLVAEDNLEVRTMLKRLLEKTFSNVEVVADGELLLNELTSGKKYNAVVMGDDIQKIQPSDIMRKVRTVPELKNLPVVVLTMHSTTKGTDRNTTYLSRLTDIGNLNATIRKMTEKA